MNDIRLLALSGSLRRESYNTAVLNALIRLAPGYVKMHIGQIGELPLFNPDREGEAIATVDALKGALGKADGLIIASPEYAHGVSGVLKNALDWLVSGEEFVDRPIMLINTSPRASHAQQSLREILRTMSGDLIDDACLSIALLGSRLDCSGIITNPETSAVLRSGLARFCTEIANPARRLRARQRSE